MFKMMNIAIIFAILVCYGNQELVYPQDICYLRVPMGVYKKRAAGILADSSPNRSLGVREMTPAMPFGADEAAEGRAAEIILPDIPVSNTEVIKPPDLYYFGGRQADGNASMKDALGKKGANLAEMTLLGLPVPPGFTIPNTFVKQYSGEAHRFPPEIEQMVVDGVAGIEERTEAALGKLKKLGNAQTPLFLSVRSGAAESSPGEYKTITKVGLHRTTLDAYAREIGDVCEAYYDYLMFMENYSSEVMDDSATYVALDKIRNEASFIDRYYKGDYHSLSEIASIEELRAMVDKAEIAFKQIAGRDFPNPQQQLIEATRAVVRSCYPIKGTACNVQAYVFGNVNDGKSGSGVIFTRNPLNGEKGIYGSFLLHVEGTMIVGTLGTRSRNYIERDWDTPKGIDILRHNLPEVYAQLERYARFLETHFREIQDIEFTVQNGKLFFLQTRGNEKFTTPLARVRMLVDFVKEGMLTETEAIERLQIGYTAPSYFALEPQEVLAYLWWLKSYLETPVLRKDFPRQPIGSGVIILPGIVNAPIYANWMRDTGSDGIVVVKAVMEHADYATFSPSLLMHRGVGAISRSGNFSDHIAVRMRGAERIIPYLTNVGLHIDEDGKTVTFKDSNTKIESGGMIILDGNNGHIYSGTLSPSDLVDSEITKVNKGVIQRQGSELFHYYETLLRWIVLFEINNVMSRVKKDERVVEEKLSLKAEELFNMFEGSDVLERLASSLAGNEFSVNAFKQRLCKTVDDIKKQCQTAAILENKPIVLGDVKKSLVSALQDLLEPGAQPADGINRLPIVSVSGIAVLGQQGENSIGPVPSAGERSSLLVPASAAPTAGSGAKAVKPRSIQQLVGHQAMTNL